MRKRVEETSAAIITLRCATGRRCLISTYAVTSRRAERELSVALTAGRS